MVLIMTIAALIGISRSATAINWVNINAVTPSNLGGSNYDQANSGAKGSNSIAIGNKAVSEGNSSIAIGNNVKNNGVTDVHNGNYGSYGSTAIGLNNTNTGFANTTIGYGETTIGNYNTAVGAMNDTAGKYNNVYGSLNDAKNNRSTVVGYRNASHGYSSLVVGGENNLMFVSQFQATGKFAETADFGVAIGNSNTVLGSRSAGVGNANIVTGTQSYSFGGDTTNSGRESILIGTKSGVGNGISDLENFGPKDDVQRVTLVGQYATSAISDSIVLGSYSFASRDSGVAGYDAASGKQLTAAEMLAKNGSDLTVAELSNKMAELDRVKLELENKTWEADKIRVDLQTGKYTDKNEYKQKVNEFDRLNKETIALHQEQGYRQKEIGDLIGNWQSQLAAMSIGNEEIGVTRQITGVAAGTNDTDAVNVAQLKSLAEKPVTISNGGKVENGHYTPGTKEAATPLNKLAFDYGEGLKAVKGTGADGSEAVVVQVDRDKIPDKKEVVTMIDKKVQPVNNRVTKVENKVTQVDNKVTKMDNRVTKVENKVTNVDNRVTVLNNRVDQMDNRIKDTNSRVDRVERRTSEGLAAVASMSVLDFNDAPVGKLGVGAAIGGYRGKQAVAVGVVYGVNENFKVNAKIGIPVDSHKNSAYGVSGTYYFNCD